MPERSLSLHVRIALAYLVFETLALIVYWTLLSARPRLREPFVPPGGDDRALFAFATGDLLLYAATGLLGVVAILRAPSWRAPVLWIHAGAAAYAALYALTLWVMDPSRWLGALMMLPAVATPFWIARRLGGVR